MDCIFVEAGFITNLKNENIRILLLFDLNYAIIQTMIVAMCDIMKTIRY